VYHVPWVYLVCPCPLKIVCISHLGFIGSSICIFKSGLLGTLNYTILAPLYSASGGLSLGFRVYNILFWSAVPVILSRLWKNNPSSKLHISHAIHIIPCYPTVAVIFPVKTIPRFSTKCGGGCCERSYKLYIYY